MRTKIESAKSKCSRKGNRKKFEPADFTITSVIKNTEKYFERRSRSLCRLSIIVIKKIVTVADFLERGREMAAAYV